jgi:hypothetical protein
VSTWHHDGHQKSYTRLQEYPISPFEERKTTQRDQQKQAWDKGWAGHLNKAFLLAQLIQFGLLLGRVKEEHTLASRSQTHIPAVAQSHHRVQAIKPAMWALVSAHDKHFQCWFDAAASAESRKSLLVVSADLKLQSSQHKAHGGK